MSVATPVPSAIVALVGVLSVSVNVSVGSTVLSVTSGTDTGCVVTPGANVSVPAVLA